MGFKVVITDYIYGEPTEEIEILKKIDAEVSLFQCKTENDVIQVARDADAILNTYAPVSRRVIERLERCRVIARYGIGYDTIDVEAATEKGIVVVNVPTYCIDEVADHTLALILCALRKITVYDKAIRKGSWDWRDARPINRLKEMTLGLIAVGKIGRALAERVKPIGMRIIAFDPYVSEKKMREIGIEPVSLDRLLRESDVISIHTPLTKETRHMINYDKLKLMKRGAILVNTSRGGVIKTDDLVRALEEGLIAFAALDVLEDEPPPKDHPLLKFENVVLTPHASFYSEGSLKEVKNTAAEEIVRVLTGRKPLSCVNPDVLTRVELK
ncbi:MAG: C-terminal binding protein [Methanomassiliicoccales archaeon]|jgi:D-3-phosphoglycerate dehydrogenase|nr:C-terminal binding protein [Methanomassiliicoccales archaeon]